MKSKTKIWLRVSLCLLLALVTLMSAACGGNGGKKAQTTAKPSDPQQPTTPEGEENPLETIEVRNFDRDLVILSPGYGGGSWYTTNGVSYEETIAGDPILEQEYKRTLAFEEKYNCSVYASGASSQDVYNSLDAMQRMQSTDYDLVYPHPTDAICTMMTSGFFKDLNTVETMDLESDWYNQRQVQNYQTNGKLYLAASDITVTGQAFFAIVYNRANVAKYQFPSTVKDLVEAGNWTVETFNEMITLTEFAGDNEDGTQLYGFSFNDMAIGRWIWALGGSILDKNVEGEFVSGMTKNKVLALANALHTLINTHGSTVTVECFANAGIPTSKLYTYFTAGKSVFIMFDIGSNFTYLRDVEFEKGYAPLPKLDKSQPDYYVNCASGLMAIPAVTTSFEESGLMFEFFARYSHVNLLPTFFETILGGRLSEFPEDYEMLNFLHSKKTFDVGYTLDEKGIFLNLLQVPVVTNKMPDGAAIILASKNNDMKEILKIANGIE